MSDTRPKGTFMKTSIFVTSLSVLLAYLATNDEVAPAEHMQFRQYNHIRLPLIAMALFFSNNKTIGFKLSIIFAMLFEMAASLIIKVPRINQYCAVAIDDEKGLFNCVISSVDVSGTFWTSLLSLVIFGFYIRYPEYFKFNRDVEQQCEYDEGITFSHLKDIKSYCNMPLLAIWIGCVCTLHFFRIITLNSDVIAVRWTLVIYCLSRIQSTDSILVRYMTILLGEEWSLSVLLF